MSIEDGGFEKSLLKASDVAAQDKIAEELGLTPWNAIKEALDPGNTTGGVRLSDGTIHTFMGPDGPAAGEERILIDGREH